MAKKGTGVLCMPKLEGSSRLLPQHCPAFGWIDPRAWPDTGRDRSRSASRAIDAPQGVAGDEPRDRHKVRRRCLDRGPAHRQAIGDGVPVVRGPRGVPTKPHRPPILEAGQGWSFNRTKGWTLDSEPIVAAVHDALADREVTNVLVRKIGALRGSVFASKRGSVPVSAEENAEQHDRRSMTTLGSRGAPAKLM